MKRTYATVRAIYELPPDQQDAVVAYLKGALTLSGLSVILGHKAKSPQAAVNTVAGVCRQWVMQGKLTFEKTELGEHL